MRSSLLSIYLHSPALSPSHPKAVTPNMAAISTYNAAGPGAANQLFIQHALPALNVPLAVLDTVANVSAAGWTWVDGAGKILSAAPGAPGIYSTGQMNCMVILVAFFNPPVGHATQQWTQCYLAHVSDRRSTKVQDTIDLMATYLTNPANAGQIAYVAIAGKVGTLAGMQDIAQRFANVLPPRPQQVLIYSGTMDAGFAMGMRTDGQFGQVTY